MTWQDNMGPERAALLASARPREAKEHMAQARQAVVRGDFAMARASYLQCVESWRQANELTAGAYKNEWGEATREYQDFAAKDPILANLMSVIEPVVRQNPGILQTELYKKLSDTPKSEISYALYFADKLRKLARKKSGRTYEIRLL